MGPLRQLRLSLLQAGLRAMGTRQQRLLAWRAMEVAGVRSATFERDGIVWTVPLGDAIAFHLFVDGGYQLPEIRALSRHIGRCGLLSGSRNVIVDVGANIGTTCVPFVSETTCRALAIEPVADNFRLLTMNVESAGLGDRILAVQKAVLRAPGHVRMRLTKGASGGNFVCREDDPGASSGGADYEEVEADGLAAIVDAAGLDADEIALVWADVQGCEADVIESGAPLWARGVPLWAEVEPHSLARQGSLGTFAALAAIHFDRFIAARDLLRLGDRAHPVPIDRLAALIDAITPEQVNTDVLFLPPLGTRVARE